MDAVKKELNDDSRTKHCAITVSRCNGRIRLTGLVGSFYQKQIVTCVAMRGLKGEELENDLDVVENR